MFEKLFTKISTFADHHQALVAVVIALSLICVSWGIEEILDNHIFPKKGLFGYMTAIIIGSLTLFVVQHYILHVI